MTVKNAMAYINFTVANVYIGKGVQCYSDSEDWNGKREMFCGYRTYW